MHSTRKSISYARRQCCRQAHKMKNQLMHSALILSAVLAVAVPGAAKAQNYRTQIDTTVRLDRGGTVDLSLISGRIRVTGWDRPDVKISASIESGELRFDANSSRVSISVEDSDNESGRHNRRHNVGEAHYDVSVPRGSRLILEAVSGDITAAGSQGEIEAQSVSGDVDVSNGVGEVSAESVSGSVHAAQIKGNLRAETVSGDLRTEGVTGNIESSSVSGNVRLIGAQSKDVRAETVSGDVVYDGTIDAGGKYSFESHSGTIRLDVPRGAGAQFSVETFSGDVSTDFPVTLAPNPGNRRREGRMEFQVGDGKARVTAQTFSGRIVINSGSNTRRDDE
jgi:DUF4097 and DUF4098 domain-containing protein YvlB